MAYIVLFSWRIIFTISIYTMICKPCNLRLPFQMAKDFEKEMDRWDTTLEHIDCSEASQKPWRAARRSWTIFGEQNQIKYYEKEKLLFIRS